MSDIRTNFLLSIIYVETCLFLIFYVQIASNSNRLNEWMNEWMNEMHALCRSHVSPEIINSSSHVPETIIPASQCSPRHNYLC